MPDDHRSFEPNRSQLRLYLILKPTITLVGVRVACGTYRMYMVHQMRSGCNLAGPQTLIQYGETYDCTIST